MSELTLQDQIKGVLYGNSVGDATGLGSEFMTKAEVAMNYPLGLRHYSQIIKDRHRQRFGIGNWTDDTEQMLCILDSLVAEHRVIPVDIAKRIDYWARNDGNGLGSTVGAVIRSDNFLINPHEAARQVWEKRGHKAAANGGVMRTSVLGIWDFWDREQVIKNAELACKVTHYDPRCIASCVAVCVAISEILFHTLKKEEFTIDEIIKVAIEEGAKYDEGIRELPNLSLAELKLDEDHKIGFTYKATGAGFWALKHSKTFEDGIIDIINEGGDADTNGAVAGSMLGAKFGFNAIPKEWTELLQRERLEKKVNELYQVIFVVLSDLVIIKSPSQS